MSATLIHTAVTASPLDPAAASAAISAGRTDIGALVSFTGLCRDEDGRLAALELEHYPGMAEAEIARIAAEAAARWPLQALTVLHRHGPHSPRRSHRRRCRRVDASPRRLRGRRLRDGLPEDAGPPFWKKEHGRDGSVGGWVEARSADDVAEARWAVGTTEANDN